MIATTFIQRLSHVFKVRQRGKTSGNNVQRLGMSKTKDTVINRKYIGNNVYRARIHVSNEIPMARLRFLGPGNTETSGNTVRRLGLSEIKDGGQ